MVLYGLFIFHPPAKRKNPKFTKENLYGRFFLSPVQLRSLFFIYFPTNRGSSLCYGNLFIPPDLFHPFNRVQKIPLCLRHCDGLCFFVFIPNQSRGNLEIFLL